MPSRSPAALADDDVPLVPIGAPRVQASRSAHSCRMEGAPTLQPRARATSSDVAAPSPHSSSPPTALATAPLGSPRVRGGDLLTQAVGAAAARAEEAASERGAAAREPQGSEASGSEASWGSCLAEARARPRWPRPSPGPSDDEELSPESQRVLLLAVREALAAERVGPEEEEGDRGSNEEEEGATTGNFHKPLLAGAAAAGEAPSRRSPSNPADAVSHLCSAAGSPSGGGSAAAAAAAVASSALPWVPLRLKRRRRIFLDSEDD